MSDEEDYMSEEFLKSLEKQDVRPGLVFSHRTKRQHEADKRKSEHDPKSKRQREEEIRQEGLSKPIDSSNKGFQMLMKMGFKGGSVGKDAEASQPMQEPIPITLKSDRKGLRQRLQPKKGKLEDKVLLDKYHEMERSNLSSRQTKGDVHLSRKACYNLDSQEAIDFPIKEYYWPWHVIKSLKPKDEENAEEENEEPTDEEYAEQLLDLTKYLRMKYNYCVWCGIRFEDTNDMQETCPGDNRASHDD